MKLIVRSDGSSKLVDDTGELFRSEETHFFEFRLILNDGAFGEAIVNDRSCFSARGNVSFINLVDLA